jgi:hypothetical protein
MTHVFIGSKRIPKLLSRQGPFGEQDPLEDLCHLISVGCWNPIENCFVRFTKSLRAAGEFFEELLCSDTN